jgi:nucleoside-diphosphate-sugar epimerase
MRILVIGGTGNFGKFIFERLCHDPNIELLVSFSRNKPSKPHPNVNYVLGDSNSKIDLERVLSTYPFDVVIHIPNILLAKMEDVIACCEVYQVKQIIVVGSAAMFTNLDAPTKEIRLEKEEIVRNSSIAHTILRPNMVYGHRNDLNIYKLLVFLKKYRVLFVPGSADILQNPSHIEDFTQGVINALLNPKAYNKSYNLVGSMPVSLRDMAKALMEGKRILIIEFPLWLGLYALKAFRFLRLANWHPEKLLRLNEQKILESTPDAFIDLEYQPRSFVEGIKSYSSGN